MEFIRYRTLDGSVRVGASADGAVTPLPFVSMAELLRLPLDELRRVVEAVAEFGEAATPADASGVAELLPPIDGRTEVWASGVTYLRSREARVEESLQQDAYERVYGAERPELFFKANAWRAVTDGEVVGIRADSALNVPEPELCLAINSAGEIIGYLVCNDMSSRSIEGENTLYLPQAKVYAGACALSHGIRPVWEVDGSAVPIRMAILREGATVFDAETSSRAIQRPLGELAEYLFRGDAFPDGALLSTGTGIVPELSFTLQDGDEIRIVIDGVGSLTNTVVTGVEPFAYLQQRNR
jgi:2-dehydro-3-deoxy-D-arabinonate dehydratase